jgi:hypothetical protein
MWLQEEVELRASVLRVHRLAIATRSRSLPLRGFDLSSSSANSSKPGSRESSADQAAALAHALTVHDPSAAAAEHGEAAALEQVAAAAAAAADRMMSHRGTQPDSSSGHYRRARSWGHDFSSSKGGGAGHHVTFMHAQHDVATPAAAAAAIAALDLRPSALYTAAADALGAFGKPAGAAAAAAAVAADDAAHSSSNTPQVSFAIPVEGSNHLQEQGSGVWGLSHAAGQISNAAAAGSIPAAAAVLARLAGIRQSLQHYGSLGEQQEQQQTSSYHDTAPTVATAAPDNSTYASAESLAGASAPQAAGNCSTLVSSSCGSMPLQQQAARRTFTNLAAPLTPMLRDVLSSCSTPAPAASMCDAASSSMDQQTLLVSHGSNSSEGSSKISSTSGCRKLQFSPVTIDGLPASADTPSSQPSPYTQQQQQQEQQVLPSAVSALYEDALEEYCDVGEATDQQQQRRQRRVSWHHDVVPSARDVSLGASAKGNSSNHSCSTHSATSAFQSACSAWSPVD